MPAAEQLAERLLQDGVIPAAHSMDFLLTWNCRHLNNRSLERRIEQAGVECGLTCLVICTPNELMEE